jgi:hypothetical protein
MVPDFVEKAGGLLWLRREEKTSKTLRKMRGLPWDISD